MTATVGQIKAVHDLLDEPMPSEREIRRIVVRMRSQRLRRAVHQLVFKSGARSGRARVSTAYAARNVVSCVKHLHAARKAVRSAK